MPIYAAKYVGVNPEPSGWIKVGDIAVDISGLANPSDYPFLPGIDENYDTSGYIIISDTTTAGLVGRTTGNNTGVSISETPTYWVSPNKTEDSFLFLVNRLPARSGQSPFVDTSSAQSWLNSNGYWTSFTTPGNLIMFLSSTSSVTEIGGNPVAPYIDDLSTYSNDSLIMGTYYLSYYNNYEVLRFNGTDAYIESPSFGITLDNKFTFETWVLPNSLLDGIIIAEWGGPPPNGWNDAQSAFVGGKINIGVYYGGYIQGPTFSAYNWYQIVSVYTGTELKLYIDGTLIGTQSIVKANSGDTYLTLGRDDVANAYLGGANGYLGGYFGQWKIYDYDLTETEILNNYSVYKNVYDNNLILHVDSNNNDSYAGSGSNWFDISLKGNHGTITNATFVSIISPSINSFYFDGNGDYVLVGQPLSSGSSYTINAWVNASDTSGSRNIVSSQDTPFWIANGTLYGGVGGNYTVVSSGSFPTGVWKFVSVTFNDSANTMKLYINGSLVNTNSSVTQTYTSQNTYIGAHYFGGPTSFWNGYISAVSIYDRVLSDNDILSQFELTKTTYGI